MSFYANAAMRAKEAKAARERQMEEELKRRERVRKELSYSLKDARAEEVKSIQQAREEYQVQFRQYYKAMRDSVLSSPDLDGYFAVGPALDCDPAVERDICWSLFLKDFPDFYNSEENRNTLAQYFTVNNCQRYDRWVLSAAYKRLLSLGLLETEQQSSIMIHEQPTPETAVPCAGEVLYHDADGPVFAAHSYDFFSQYKKASDRLQGQNPETGEDWILTARQANNLDADSFRKFCNVSKSDRDLSRVRSDYRDERR
jgi:hypothetical protein